LVFKEYGPLARHFLFIILLKLPNCTSCITCYCLVHENIAGQGASWVVSKCRVIYLGKYTLRVRLTVLYRPHSVALSMLAELLDLYISGVYYYSCYHLNAGYLQLYTSNKPCFCGMWCCSCSVFTGCANVMLFRPWNMFYTFTLGTAVAQWLRCCATNRKVAGSIPADVIGIFHWHEILPIALWSWGRLSL